MTALKPQLQEFSGVPVGGLPPRRVHAAGREWVIFGPPHPDHMLPALLDDAALAESVSTLRAKLRSAYMELAEAHLRGAALSGVSIAGAAILLWLGPATLVDALGGRGIATAWDVIFWWIVLAPVTAIAGGLGVFSLTRRLREVRGWRHRTTELSSRLADARREQARRSSPDFPPPDRHRA